MPAKRQSKASLQEAARKLTAIAERHLTTLPEEEQEARVAGFARLSSGLPAKLHRQAASKAKQAKKQDPGFEPSNPGARIP